MADKEVVFVVEDEFLVRESIVRELEDAGFGVMTAECGDEALDILSKQPRIDVLLTDIRMPGRINGWTLADMARRQSPKLPVIYMSGFCHDQGMEVEGSLFLAKPYRADEMMRAIEKLLCREKK
jgi:CheY-like chemotaxis protein